MYMRTERIGRILSELKQLCRSVRTDIDSIRYREDSFRYEDRRRLDTRLVCGYNDNRPNR